jgi:hypothetical protein
LYSISNLYYTNAISIFKKIILIHTNGHDG